ncbi:MAG: tripartite tricarboxylate transporter TctB family protein [Burkholderiales bacterium]|nr:tripartite tricarboxylate transporter TctB family protein [Burkholderiales bacterium]
MRRADIVVGLLLTLFGLVSLFAIIPAQVGSAAGDAGVAPDLFPLVLMSLLTGLAVLLWVSRLVHHAKADEPAPLRPEDFFYILAASIVLAASFLAITHLGFIAGGVLTVAVAMLAMEGRHHPLRLVATSLLAPLAVFAFFRYLFSILLP